MTDHREDQLAVVLGQRQLIAVFCMFLVVLGLVSTLAYVAGRSITAAQMQNTDKTETVAPIVVDPSRVPPALEARAATLPPPIVKVSQPAEPVPAPAPAVTPAFHPAPSQPVTLTEPAPGQLFWQVGLVDRGVGIVFVEHLTRLGLAARTAAGGSLGTVRVLVGPVSDSAETEKARRALEAAGFQCFLKRY